jgi:hypothetical protein
MPLEHESIVLNVPDADMRLGRLVRGLQHKPGDRKAVEARFELVPELKGELPQMISVGKGGVWIEADQEACGLVRDRSRSR